MKSKFEIARRLYGQTEGRQTASRSAVKVAVVSILLGVLVMMLTLSIVLGFKQTVSDKTIGFGGHIQLVNFDNNSTYEMQPIVVSDSLLAKLSACPHVVSAMPFVTKPGILKTEDAFHGVVVKGLAEDDLREVSPSATFFKHHLVEGSLPLRDNDILLSRTLSARLHLPCDTTVLCYFVGDDVRARKYHISGVYDTQFADFDDLFLIGKLSPLRQLNGWEDHQASGIEVRIAAFSDLPLAEDEVYFEVCNRLDEEGNALYMQTIVEKNPAIFSWLSLLDMNVVVIIVLMLLVSGMGIISGLIILILESVQTIGTFKALGASNRYIRTLFLYQAGMLVVKGLVWGNVLGLLLCAVQYFLHVVPLDPATYYVGYVPIAWCWEAWLLLDIGTLFVMLLMLLLPSAVIAHISPSRVMRFE